MVVETWEAERFEEEKKSGRTRPLVIECSRPIVYPDVEKADKNPVSNDVVKRLMLVKTINSEIQARGLFCELYGNLIAREFGVHTPLPALVSISAEFVAAMQLTPATKQIVISPGIGVGCEYLRGLAPAISNSFRNNEELADIQVIYGVDMLMQNPDRRIGKPNCASYQGTILAYDFELALSFLLPLIGIQPSVWAVHEQGIHRNHFFYNELKRRQSDLDWTPFLNKLQGFTPEKLTTFFASVPAAWQPYADRVIAHLSEVRANATKFGESLIRSLL